jgi:hypothetical protein
VEPVLLEGVELRVEFVALLLELLLLVVEVAEAGLHVLALRVDLHELLFALGFEIAADLVEEFAALLELVHVALEGGALRLHLLALLFECEDLIADLGLLAVEQFQLVLVLRDLLGQRLQVCSRSLMPRSLVARAVSR